MENNTLSCFLLGIFSEDIVLLMICQSWTRTMRNFYCQIFNTKCFLTKFYHRALIVFFTRWITIVIFQMIRHIAFQYFNLQVGTFDQITNLFEFFAYMDGLIQSLCNQWNLFPRNLLLFRKTTILVFRNCKNLV